MKVVHFIKHILFLIIAQLDNADLCLDRPETGMRGCLSNKVDSYNDKSETERILWTKTQVLSNMKCSILCIEDIRCVSFFYNNSTKTCTGHSIVFGDSNAASTETGNVLYNFDSAKGYIGDLCNTDSDCFVVNSECRADCVNTTTPLASNCSAKRCWCTSGYSFSPTQHTCELSCSVLGDDYMRSFLYFISTNYPANSTGESLDVCKQNCTSSTTCKSIQYGSVSLNCYLLSTTKFDWPDSAWYYDNWYYQYSYYQRDCQ